MTDSSTAILAQPTRKVTRSFSSSTAHNRRKCPQQPAIEITDTDASSSGDLSITPGAKPRNRTRRPVVRTCSEKSHRIPGARREQNAAFLDLMGDFLDDSPGGDQPAVKKKKTHTKKGFASRLGKAGRFTSRGTPRNCSSSPAKNGQHLKHPI